MVNSVITKVRFIALLMCSFAVASIAMLMAFLSKNNAQATNLNFCSQGNGSYATPGTCAYSPGSGKEYCGMDLQGDALWYAPCSTMNSGRYATQAPSCSNSYQCQS